MSRPRILWYFADPMCSWCWGFAPVIGAIKENYAEQLQLALVMGGLRPGTTELLTPERREELLHHWQEVEQRTGQPFRYEGAMPAGFIYDTEPASRAVVTVEELKPEAKFDYFKSVQAAFYANGQDVTQPGTLAALAEQQGIASGDFLVRFQSEDIIERTYRHFEQTHQTGIRGFPAAVLQSGGGFKLLTYGYAPLAELTPKIDAWLAEND